MRVPQPWKRSRNETWYVTLNGVQHRLGRDEAEAKRLYLKLLAKYREHRTGPEENVRRLLLLYWDSCKKNLAPSTCERRRPILQSFANYLDARLKAYALKTYHVTKWIETKYPRAGSTYQNTLITTIKGALEWAVGQGYIDHNPIRKAKKPRPAIRQDFVPAVRWPEVIAAATDDCFREFLTVMLATGARPHEMFVMAARHLDSNRIVFPVEESKGRRRNRVIYLSADALEIINRLAAENSNGPLFRNRKGRGWTRSSIKDRFRRMKRVLQMPKLTATTLRHSFAHHRLVSGQHELVVAKLMGHVDGRMLATRYGHLEQNSDFMASEANRIASPFNALTNRAPEPLSGKY